MTAEHVHGAATVTTSSGRVFCSCGYERTVFVITTPPVRTVVGWVHNGGPDPEGDEMRRLLRARRVA